LRSTTRGNVFVADGTNLVEVNAWGGQTSITSSLMAPVTGLAVDPSGSVYVAQSGGVIRIPLESSGLNANDAAAVDNTGVTSPTGVGIDSLGNLYVTADSYNVTTINTSGTPLDPVTTSVTTPNVLMLANADVDFGFPQEGAAQRRADDGAVRCAAGGLHDGAGWMHELGLHTHAPAPQVKTPAGTYQVSIYTIDLVNNQRSSLPFTLTVTVQ
jgi:hypothetical protein